MMESRIGASESALLNAYLDNNLSSRKRDELEGLISGNQELAKLFHQKSEERQALRSLIPNKKPSKDSMSLMKSEIREVNKDLFPSEKVSLVKKIAKILDKTILEF